MGNIVNSSETITLFQETIPHLKVRHEKTSLASNEENVNDGLENLNGNPTTALFFSFGVSGE